MSYVADAQLDNWRSRQEVKEAIAHEELLAQRLRCPDCGKLGVWYVVRVKRNRDFVEGPIAYCSQHAGNLTADNNDPLSVISLNWCGWLADGTTWEDGWPKF